MARAPAATYNVAQPTKMAEPAPAVYGVMGPAYAASLQSNDGNNILTQMALRGEAGKERQSYEDQLRGSQQAYLTGLGAENRAKLEEALVNNAAPNAEAGVSGAYGVGPNGTLQVNQPQLLTSDATHLNATHAKQVLDVANANEAFSKAGGGLSQPYLNTAIAAPGQTDTNGPDGQPMLTMKAGPSLRDIDQEKADAAKATAAADAVKAQASRVRAEKGVGDSTSTTVVSFDPQTLQTRTDKTVRHGAAPEGNAVPGGSGGQAGAAPIVDPRFPYGPPGTVYPVKGGGKAQVGPDGKLYAVK